MKSESMDRQEFLHSLTRKGMLLGMIGLSIPVLHGSKDPSECFDHNYCSECLAYRGCGLPEKIEVSHERTEKIRPA